jgi:8-oxo-dGTP diphosphatase
MISKAGKPVVNVAAGVLTRADGKVLLAERPANKTSGGHWEFPGGKFDAGEDERQALAREVAEEVGVVIGAAVRWLTYDHEYADKVVRLHIHKVSDWHGSPRGQEGQRITWQHPAELSVSPLMEAYRRALEALRLPTVIAIARAECCGRSELLDRMERALRGGARTVVLRERHMLPAQFAQVARRGAELARRYGAKVLVEGGKVHSAHCNADGVHVCSGRLLTMAKPPAGAVWSASCRTADHLARAAARGAAFALVTPQAGGGNDWDAFGRLIQHSAVPVFASGGVTPADMENALGAGAHGLALPLSAW